MIQTVIFDMDGLLIDSEPLWYEAAYEVFVSYGIRLTPVQYATTTGLRTKEFIQWWFREFNILDADHAAVDRALAPPREAGHGVGTPQASPDERDPAGHDADADPQRLDLGRMRCRSTNPLRHR